MKKTLLSIAFAAIAASGMAQWTTDTHGNQILSADEGKLGLNTVHNSNGTSFTFIHRQNAWQNEDGTWTREYPMTVQVRNGNGYLLTSQEGLLLSNNENTSSTVVNENIAIAPDGSAICAVRDLRANDGNMSMALYKVGEDGTLIWGDKVLNGGESIASSIYMTKICPTQDGGVAVAYLYYDEEWNSILAIEKLGADGNALWSTTVADGENEVGYPYLAALDNNQIAVIYVSADNAIKARMLNADGTNAWTEDATIYDGGFPMRYPINQLINVTGSSDMAIVTWAAVNSETGNYANHMTYVGSEGVIATVDNLITKNLSCMQPDCYYDESQEATYGGIYVYNSALQDIQGIYVQKISKTGERMWGDIGIAVEPVEFEEGETIDPSTLNYMSAPVVRNMGDGKAAVFYLMQIGEYSYTGPNHPYMSVVDYDGELITHRKVLLEGNDNNKGDLWVSELIDGDHFLMTWSERAGTFSFDIYITSINIDGTITGVEKIDAETANQIIGQQFYDVNGRRHSSMQPGVNIVRNVHQDGSITTQKIMK